MTYSAEIVQVDSSIGQLRIKPLPNRKLLKSPLILSALVIGMRTAKGLIFGILVYGVGFSSHVGSIASAGEGGLSAISCDDFLSSLGVNTHVDQGYDPVSYIEPLRYLGVRNIRDSERNLSGTLMLHEQTGVQIDLLLGGDLPRFIEAARIVAKARALLSMEGPNEPNNFPITYNGERGGGNSLTWVPVAKLQSDLYGAVKKDPDLSRYPVFQVSEGGAETEDVGLQFLKIPVDARTLLPDGTLFADYANVHNYVSGVRTGYLDNQAWRAADPVLNSHWDGLYGEYGRTWKRHFRGYSNDQLETLPRVTTETGWNAPNPQEERIQGIVLVNTYLAQFKRGWRYTFLYELGEGEGGNGNQGLFHVDWTPKLAATYIHNLTSILADSSAPIPPRKLDYAITQQPPTVHDLLLEKSSGAFELLVWGEQVAGVNTVLVNLGRIFARVAIYDITADTTPFRVLHNIDSLSLTVGDHAMIVEVQ
jgi:hypothetical protein